MDTHALHPRSRRSAGSVAGTTRALSVDRTMSARRWLALVIVAWAVLFVSSPAAAYCRKSTDSPTDESFDPATAGGCGDKDDALPLYWSEGCVEYSITIDQDLIDN